MASVEITNNAINGIVVWEPVFEDEVLTAAGAETWQEGTLLGRITSGGKLTRYDPGASDGSEVAVAVLQDEVVFAGAGDLAYRPIINGRLRRGDLKVFPATAITDAQSDALRDYGIVPLRSKQLAELDNQ